MLVVIDYRNLAKNLSHSIRSGSIPCIFPTEPEEISHRIMKRLYCIRAAHPSDSIVLANDLKPYWRERYMERWYNSRSLEPVLYKGNRGKQDWLFRTTPGEMEQLYAQLLTHGAASIGATVIQDAGLEADDIFGVLAKTYDGEVLGISTDTDWAQLVSDRVKVENLATGEMQSACDIRIKWIGGDPGDNVPGSPKRKKNGDLAAKGWGQVGAAKLLQDPDWESQVDMDHVERNRVLTTLPCPTWDLRQAEENLISCAVRYPSTSEYWDRYGVTEAVRRMLDNRADRDAWIAKLRLHLLRSKDETRPKAED